jgi:hypothetical protein
MQALYLIWKGEKCVEVDSFSHLDGADLNATARSLLDDYSFDHGAPLLCRIYLICPGGLAFVGEERQEDDDENGILVRKRG